MIINDGTGSGASARVGADKRLQVRAITELENIHAAELGTAYNLNTGLISVSGDATLMYVKNTNEQTFIITAIALGSFEGITHSDDPYLTLIKNPTGGDLITDATAAEMVANKNFGSSKTFNGLVYKGKTSGTVTGGTNIAILQSTAGGRGFYGLDFLLPQGSSMAIKLTANASSGSANYYAAIIGYFKDDVDAD